MMVRGRALSAGGWCFAIVLLSACSLLVDPFALPRDGAPDAATGDATSDAPGAEPMEECALATPPATPSIADGPSGPPLQVAIRTFFASENVGFDLDGRCTGAGARFGGRADPSCAPRVGVASADGLAGVDNATSELLRRAQSAAGLAKADLGFDEIAAQGRQTLLVNVAGYNGQLDDPDVTVSVYESPGLEASSLCAVGDSGVASDAGLDDSGSDAASLPTWSGCDTWSVAPNPPSESTRAWVTNGVLVARFETLPVRFGDVYLLLRRVVATLRKANEPNPKLLIAGTIDPSDLVAALGEAVVFGAPVCSNAPLFAGLRQLACDSVDLHVGGEVAGPRCNQLSFGAEFETVNARFGPSRPSRPVPSRCGDAGKVACSPP